jgi:histidine ammonia-lyase
MCLEYVATAALAELSGAAIPASTFSAVLSRGVEDDASFASAAARQALEAEAALEVVLACEGVAAARALRSADTTARTALLGDALEVCADLPADLTDRDLTPDLDLFGSRMTELAAVLPPPGWGRG